MCDFTTFEADFRCESPFSKKTEPIVNRLFHLVWRWCDIGCTRAMAWCVMPRMTVTITREDTEGGDEILCISQESVSHIYCGGHGRVVTQELNDQMIIPMSLMRQLAACARPHGAIMRTRSPHLCIRRGRFLASFTAPQVGLSLSHTARARRCLRERGGTAAPSFSASMSQPLHIH